MSNIQHICCMLTFLPNKFILDFVTMTKDKGMHVLVLIANYKPFVINSILTAVLISHINLHPSLSSYFLSPLNIKVERNDDMPIGALAMPSC